jgi:HD-GYP domain-containing protein (c-di-GMP phosphodiesterase class II)
VNAADTWDACTSNRPYQKAYTVEEALDIVGRLRGTQLDPAVHDALVAVVRKRQERKRARRQANREALAASAAPAEAPGEPAAEPERSAE